MYLNIMPVLVSVIVLAFLILYYGRRLRQASQREQKLIFEQKRLLTEIRLFQDKQERLRQSNLLLQERQIYLQREADQALSHIVQMIKRLDEASKSYKVEMRGEILDSLSNYTEKVLYYEGYKRTGVGETEPDLEELESLREDFVRKHLEFIDKIQGELKSGLDSLYDVPLFRARNTKQFSMMPLKKMSSIEKKMSSIDTHVSIENISGGIVGRIIASRHTISQAKSKLRVSVAHPKLLSKRFTSSFLVQFYLPSQTNIARRNVSLQITDQQSVIHEYKSDVNLGQTVKVKLASPEITFPEAVVKPLTNKISAISFLGRPNDECHPGVQYATLTISDPETNEEHHSLNFPVRVVDFAFDHVSRPLLSNVTSIALGVGSLTMFMLTLLGQIDTTLGVASGTTTGVLASGFYYYVFSSYQRRNVNIP